MRMRFWRAEPLILGALVLVAAMLAFPLAADGAPKPVVPDAERLILKYQDGEIELVSRTTLKKIVPPSVELPAEKGQVSGHWIEVQNDDGETLYRRRIPAPDMMYTEAPTEDNPKLSRAEFIVSEKTFAVLIPKKDDGTALVIYGPPAGTKSRAQAAGEIGRVVLK